MNTLIAEQIKAPIITFVRFLKNVMVISLSDGRTLSIPIAWYSKLSKATEKQLKHFEISPGGYGIHWSDIDEDLSVWGFLFPGV
ncbi:MAG: DUF2442 domain-containing protein [Elusimicrobiota bacterium]